MTDVPVTAGLLGLQQHMSQLIQLVWLQIKTAHANPCRGKKVVQCGKSNVQENIPTYLKTLPKGNQIITKNTEGEPVPNPCRA